MTRETTLVFSLGQDGYDTVFKNNIESHEAYCRKYSYNYFCISDSGDLLLGRENIWLKVMAFLGALTEHKNVLYIDTDVRIQPDCPPINLAVNDANPIGLVAGHSGRVNAGVILARRTEKSIAFFREWMACLGRPLAQRHDVGWGENGHLIKLALDHNLTLLDTRWNNTFKPDLDDYLRHYTGPLRDLYLFDEQTDGWEDIKQKFNVAKLMPPLDIIRSFHALKQVYERTLRPDLFAPFDPSWADACKVTGASSSPAIVKLRARVRRVYVAEVIADDSPNAYVLTLRDGLRSALGDDAVTTGCERFWTGSFRPNEIVHIEWIESLFNWKVPDDSFVADFEERVAQIAAHNPIVYTAHNFDLMPTYGDNRLRMLRVIAKHGSMIIHLSDANVAAYNRHHAHIEGLSDLPTAVVPHGDYQPYYRLESKFFEDPALDSSKIKILVFGHIRTEEELSFCCDVADQLDRDRFQLLITGAVNPEVVHWKENHRLRDNWDGGVRRLHTKVPTDRVISLISQCDGVLVPRFARLNSGVQFLAYSMLKPAFVPAENSMEEVQSRAMGMGIYEPHNADAAARTIQRYFTANTVQQLCRRYRLNDFNYRTQGMRKVGTAHLQAYERAIEFYRAMRG